MMELTSQPALKIAMTFLASFAATYVLTPLVIASAKRYTCIDYPDERRLHCSPTPRWGGCAIALPVVPVILLTSLDRSYLAYLVSSVFLVVTGMIDDCIQINWKTKLSAILVAIALIAYGGGITIDYLGRYGAFRHVYLDAWVIPFTFLSIVGVTNAINLIDGLNGLAPGVSLLAFLFIGAAAALQGNMPLAAVSFAFTGALGAFLFYNFPDARIFMGDSGSLFLGFSLATFSILLTQNHDHPVEPMYPVLVLLIPIFDTLRVMILRVFLLKNPFHADLNHLHHLTVLKRFSPRQATLLFWFLTFLFGIIALIFLLLGKSSLPYLVVGLTASFLLSVFANTLVIDK